MSATKLKTYWKNFAGKLDRILASSEYHIVFMVKVCYRNVTEYEPLQGRLRFLLKGNRQ